MVLGVLTVYIIFYVVTLINFMPFVKTQQIRIQWLQFTVLLLVFIIFEYFDNEHFRKH